MLWVESEDSRDWKQKSRGVVLWLLHTIKLALYEQAVAEGWDPEENPTGARPRRKGEQDDGKRHKVQRPRARRR